MLTNALIYLCAAVVSVPIAKRLGLGSVLGYLMAGVVIGPAVLQLVGNQREVMHFAEFGVVIMLFLIGLELHPERLWEMRRAILGLGGLQVVLTAGVVAYPLAKLSSMQWQTALAVGLTLALSSTALVLQSLAERGLLKTQAGKNAFSVLLFQDIAVIPIMMIFPLLAVFPELSGNVAEQGSLIHDLPLPYRVTVTTLVIGAIIFGGKYLEAPFFRMIAETQMRELFVAFSLLIVIAITAGMNLIGLSPALGSFIAGVVLAESEFRHELEVNIDPFKGMLLGLFFITVGASIDVQLLTRQPLLVLGLVAALVLLKAVVLAILALLFRMDHRQGLLFNAALAQGGEFAFVLVSLGTQSGVFAGETGAYLILVVTLSMAISPLLLIIIEGVLGRVTQATAPAAGADEDVEPTCEVIIAGYGRFGQIVGRLLSAQGYHLTILDHSPSQIDLVRNFGNKVFYGDASRKELLQAAGADEAKLLVIAVDDPGKTLSIIDIARTQFPHLKILARAIDRRHAYELLNRKIDGFRRETFDSALNLGVDALKALGRSENSAQRAGELFAEHDEQSLVLLSELWGDDKSYGVATRQRLEDLKQVLNADQQTRLDNPLDEAAAK